MNDRPWKTLVPIFCIAAVFFVGTGHSQDPQQTSPRPLPPSAYHDHAPTEPLPETLDPEPFKEDEVTFVAYTLAGKIKDVLYQEPCYCPCHKLIGHESLLDCFTSRHGVSCKACKVQAVFCFVEHQEGKNPAEIREEMARGKAWEFNLDDYVTRFLARTHGSEP